MQTLEQIKARVDAALPGARLEIVPNASPANQPSLLLDHGHAREIAEVSARRSGIALRLRLQRHGRGLAGKDSQREDQSQEDG